MNICIKTQRRGEDGKEDGKKTKIGKGRRAKMSRKKMEIKKMVGKMKIGK